MYSFNEPHMIRTIFLLSLSLLDLPGHQDAGVVEREQTLLRWNLHVTGTKL